MIEVGSSVRTTIEESRNICSGSLKGSSYSFELRLGSQKPEIALSKECRSVPPTPNSGSDTGGVDAMSCLALVDAKNGDGGNDIGGAGIQTSVSCSPGLGSSSGNDSNRGAAWASTEGRAESGIEPWVEVSGFLSSTFPSPSSSASLEESELSESSLMASLMLSRTSTLARAEATGRARFPRITVYLLFDRSASLPRRSKCLAMFETLLFVFCGRRRVDLFPPPEEVRVGFGRLDTRGFVGLVFTRIDLFRGGEEGRLDLNSLPLPLCDLFSGEGLREESRDSRLELTGPGIRLLPAVTVLSALRERVRYLGATLAA